MFAKQFNSIKKTVLTTTLVAVSATLAGIANPVGMPSALAFITVSEQEPNNTSSQAQLLSMQSDRNVNVRASLSNTDSTDIFQFDATGTVSISARSNDPNAPNRPIGAILSLYQDVNGDKVLSNDELIKTVTASNTSGLVSLSVDGLGGGGRYFAKVVRNNTTTLPYTFNVDNSRTGRGGEITDVGRLVGSRQFQGSLSNTDTFDDYKFNLAATKNVTLSLSDPNFTNGNADLFVFRDVNGNGQFDFGDQTIASSTNSNSSELIQRSLTSGNYIARIVSKSLTRIDYHFNLSAR